MTEIETVPAHRVDQVDDYHGERVADPYRWLEDTDSTETAAWIAAQNVVTQRWLSATGSREQISRRLTELWDHPRLGAPFERAGHWFQWRNSGLQNQAVLYVMEEPTADGRVLLDPNVLTADGTVSVSSSAVTEDGQRLAYATNDAGSDWMTWHVRDVSTGHDLDDVVRWAKYSSASWLADGSGFYYGAVQPPQAGAELLAAASPQQIYLHRIGTPQSADELAFAAPDQPEWTMEATVSDDGRYVVVTIAQGTAPENQLRVLDRERPDAGWRTLVGDFAAKARYVTNRDEVFYLLTDAQAERQRVVAVDLGGPAAGRWREVIGEGDALLLAAAPCGGRLVCHRLQDACSQLAVFDFDGTHLGEISVPAISSLAGDHDEAGFEGHADSPLIHFGVTSFIDSGSLWQHNLQTGQTVCISPSSDSLDRTQLVCEQVFVTASDGVAIPLFLTHRRDVVPDGDVPVLMYGYGGFDISLTPVFSADWATLVERGAVFAMAVLRGGGEYGSSWHRAGIHDRKQRVFDDFCDCARWLHDSGWSRPGRIAINGGSNGGLLVGACVTQHPELFGAAIADVGVLDMLRFHRFTIGWAWKSDFGDPDDPAQYPWVRAYSPLHNVDPARRYPPILLTTGDHDDRVIPGHTFKFAATLQALGDPGDGAGPREPVLVRIETAAGHGHGMPTTKAIARATDILAFIEATVGGAR